MARAKPAAIPMASVAAWAKVAGCRRISSMAPRIAQLLVIRGRKMPTRACNRGVKWLLRVSVACTSVAIKVMNSSSRRNSMSRGLSSQCSRHHPSRLATTSTAPVATAMPSAGASCLDVPRNGHSPRNCISTKLLISAALIAIPTSSAMGAACSGGQRTGMPGSAPASGDRRNNSEPPLPAASTMPSDTPKRILRGARLATITVRRPSRAAGSS